MLRRNFTFVATLAFAIIYSGYPGPAYGELARPRPLFQFEMSAPEVARLETEIAKLKLGDSIEKVKKVLGKPSAEGNYFRKGIWSSTLVMKYLKYNLKVVKTDGKNIHDHVIALFFDASGSLIGAERWGYSKSKVDRTSFQIVEKIL